MAIKLKTPVNRSAAIFDDVDVFDIRFRLIGGKWKCVIKYKLLTDSGESDGEFYEKRIFVEENEIKKMDKLIAKIVDGIID